MIKIINGSIEKILFNAWFVLVFEGFSRIDSYRKHRELVHNALCAMITIKAETLTYQSIVL
jgi:hypothetical protein